jgi:sarcosine oxidase/L-pipecolate oxidase
VPQIAERPFSFARICWDADTPDRQFLIDHHPWYPSLLVAVGGSGNGFMTMPAVGIAVADALEGMLEPKLKHGFRWRPETARERDWRDTQNRFGGDGTVMDFQKVHCWTKVGESSGTI